MTPTFNRADYLEETIVSVLEQDYPDIEYAVVDGGSTDGSAEIIRKYEHRLAWWVSEPDRGQADAIVKGFARSTGSILAYLNSDDAYLPGAVSKAVDAFRRGPHIGVVFGDIHLVDDLGNLIRKLCFTDFDFETLLYEGGNLNQAGSFWTREIYERVGGLDPSLEFALDTDFFFRAAQASHFEHIREPLARFRIHEDTKSSTMWDVGLAECNKIRARYWPNNISAHRIAWIKRLCLVRRSLNYVRQGDAAYVWEGIKNRLQRP